MLPSRSPRLHSDATPVYRLLFFQMQIVVEQRLQSELADSVIWTILARIPRSLYPPRYVQTCPTCFDCCWAAAAPCMRPSHIGAGEHFEGVVRQVPGSSDTT
jgi:hypothetical protein